ncbi:RDD family protein [Winogradskyella endarachnes]|uniref:RDD family protein n=1 Tax=Winogradskyella endarachnes TaxID=2681965 RepID=A0A6L6U8T1_9FLAO|nr:cytochrome c oxidase assembly factor Coa1 family protein [Winogradskyella endarachnes]MUU77234.1 RDD family protein [Winogradskyella endarachnes]
MQKTSGFQYQLASRKRRIAAFLIDHFVITFLIVSITFLILGPDYLNNPDFSKITAVMLTTLLLGFTIYFGKDSINGISIGKWIFGIMVRDEDNPEVVPSIGKLFIRNIFLIIWPVEFIVLASSNEKKRLGDNIAKTRVVKNPHKPSKTPRILALILAGLIFITFLVIFIGSVMKNSDAYKVAVENIEQNKLILEETGGITGYGIMPSGSINITNGFGKAQLSITVKGIEKDVNVDVYLTKQPNEDWQLIDINN